MVTSTGKIIPSGSFCVLALNCLQKSMILTPWGPSAVPTGGAGVALPAASCNLMVVCIFFGGMFFYLYPQPRAARRRVLFAKLSTQLLNACKVQFHRRRTPENRHRNLQPAGIVVDLFHGAVEIRERSVHDAHLLVAFVNHFRFGTILGHVHAIDDGV